MTSSLTVERVPTKILGALVAAGLSALAFTNQARAEAVTFDLDPVHTTVAFWVDHVGYARTLGWFTEVSGSFDYDTETDTISNLRAIVNPASIFTNDERRDNHVRSADFLNANTFPEIIFTASEGTVTGEDVGVVTGELTLLGSTQPVALEVRLNKDEAYPFGHGKRTLGVSAEGSVNRSDFGMSYGLGGLVGDEVTIMIEVEAIARD
ncbi:MAG: YceI family protein [Pseudomonadota bacterium]